MTAITILTKDRVPTGPFTREQVAEKLKSGECSLNDLAFVEGFSEWTPLRDVLARIDGPPAAPSSPITTPAPCVPTTPISSAPAYSYATNVPSPVQTTSKLAIAAIVCGFAGIFCGITMIPAVVLGHLALSEIKKNPTLKGRSMAITSLAVGYGWIAIVALCVVIAVTGAISRAASDKRAVYTPSASSVSYGTPIQDTASTSVDSLSDVPEIDHVKQKIDPVDIGVGESTTVTIMITEHHSGSVTLTSSDFNLPTVEGLSVFTSGNQMKDSMTDGQSVFSTTKSFTVRATQAGSFIIPAFDVHMADNQVYHVQAMTLHVHP